MRKTMFLAVLAACATVLTACSTDEEPNTLSRKEKAEGFVLLFDGESTDSWKGFKKDYFPDKWVVEDGCIMFNPDVDGTGGDIVTKESYANFHLKIDWKIEEAGNSGIFYLGNEDADFGAIFFTAPEMQVLDNEKHPDAQLGTNGNRKSGSLYDLIPADPQNSLGAEVWNTAEVIHENGHVKHIQNGVVVVEYQMGTPEWNELVAGSKFPGLNPDWANVPSEGKIALQDHGNKVWFRNIKIKTL
ncbi:MAG: DUF1080 domain-containing protein [Bacteroidales bacterium]